MELFPPTLALLRDEAYTFLCREALQDQLNSLEQEKSSLASTRPPFGVLARKQTRNQFAASMRTAVDTEIAVREKLVRATQLENWLQPLIQKDLVAYLREASPEFRRFPEVERLLIEWESELSALPDMCVAFARDLRIVREALASPSNRRQSGNELPLLRDIAMRIEPRYDALMRIGQAIDEQTAAVGATEVRLPALPDLRRVGWVSQLGLLPLDKLGAEIQRMENEIRLFVASGHASAVARVRFSREACARAESDFVLRYWNQLRAHAQTHYVEECEIDEVLKTLALRYVDADIARRQRALGTHDPFLAER